METHGTDEGWTINEEAQTSGPETINEGDEEGAQTGEPDPIAILWKIEAAHDGKLAAATEAVHQGMNWFPTDLHLKVSISECSINDNGALCFRG